MENLVISGRKIVLEALERSEKIQKIYFQHGLKGQDIKNIEKCARKLKIPISHIDKRKLEQVTKNSSHQGVAALLSLKNMLFQEEFTDSLNDSNCIIKNKLYLYLDRIQDPQNFGALIRSAELFGVDAVFYPLKDTAPVSSVTIKASMGAALLIPLIGINTPFNFIELLKTKNIQIIGSLKDNESSSPLMNVHYDESICLIVGNEENGIKYSLRKLCDQFIYIPQIGKTESFNASVAGGIILYEIFRQKTARK